VPIFHLALLFGPARLKIFWIPPGSPFSYPPALFLQNLYGLVCTFFLLFYFPLQSFAAHRSFHFPTIPGPLSAHSPFPPADEELVVSFLRALLFLYCVMEFVPLDNRSHLFRSPKLTAFSSFFLSPAASLRWTSYLHPSLLASAFDVVRLPEVAVTVSCPPITLGTYTAPLFGCLKSCIFPFFSIFLLAPPPEDCPLSL